MKVPEHQLQAKPSCGSDIGYRTREIQSPTRVLILNRIRVRKEINLMFYITANKSNHFNFPEQILPTFP